MGGMTDGVMNGMMNGMTDATMAGMMGMMKDGMDEGMMNMDNMKNNSDFFGANSLPGFATDTAQGSGMNTAAGGFAG